MEDGSIIEEHTKFIKEKYTQKNGKKEKEKGDNMNKERNQLLYINSCNWFHQTSKSNANSILQQGFYIDEGGNQRYTEGIYLNSHPHGLYGDTTLQCCVSGKFIDFSNDTYGNEWVKFKSNYKYKNYTDLTKKIKNDYKKADGIIFNSMLVVWKPNKIISIKRR